MNTGFANCTSVGPPAGSSTGFVWETGGGNATVEIWQDCLV